MQKFNTQTQMLKLISSKRPFIRVYNTGGCIATTKKELKNFIRDTYGKYSLLVSGYVLPVTDRSCIIYFKKDDPDAIIGK